MLGRRTNLCHMMAAELVCGGVACCWRFVAPGRGPEAMLALDACSAVVPDGWSALLDRRLGFAEVSVRSSSSPRAPTAPKST